MLYDVVTFIYSVANITIATLVYVKSPRTQLTHFFLFCVGCLVTLGLAGLLLNRPLDHSLWHIVEIVAVFIYSLFPFFFIQFVVLFVRRYEVLKSKGVLISVYGVGILCYALTLLGLIPKPIAEDGTITQSGYTFYLTWMTIYFTIGVAMLYEAARGFYEKAGRTNILFVCFILLVLILPGPFTESVFFRILGLKSEWQYITSTLAIMVAVYFVFRHKIIVNTLLQALKSALSVLNDIFLTTSESFQIETVWGTTTSRVLGYEEGELEGRSLVDILDEKEFLAKYRERVRSGAVRESYFDANVLCKNGDRIPLHISIAPLFVNNQVAGFAAVGRDMTERKKLEMELRQSQKMESLGTLAGGMAHDFNNILQILLMNTRVLRLESDKPAKLQQTIEWNLQAIERGKSLVKRLLMFARKSEASYQPLEMNEIVKDLVRMLSQTFPKTVVFSTKIDPTIPLILADPNQLNQVLMNLCINARDAMPDGGKLTVGTGVISGSDLAKNFATADRDQYICISVADSGHGMDKATQSHIFEPFFTTKEVGKGTGLGLAVAYGIVQAHHGFIGVESTVGVGTTFSVYLPVTPNLQKNPPAKEGEAEEVRRARETVLVAEDEEIILNSLYAVLGGHGYKVLIARDGLEAIEMFKNHKDEIDLVISDVGLPKLSGWDAFLKMKEIKPNVKTIMASGYLDPQVKAERLEGGVTRFISKPYDPDDVLEIMREVIDHPKN